MNKAHTHLAFSDLTLSALKEGHIGKSGAEIVIEIPRWELKPGEFWGVIGGSDSQRQAICRLLRESLLHGNHIFKEVSAELQASIVDEENNNARSGLADQMLAGMTLEEYFQRELSSHAESKKCFKTLDILVERFDFRHCMKKHFRELSSGETRRALLIAALAYPVDYYLFHSPYEGLDRETQSSARSAVDEMLSTPSDQKYPKPMKVMAFIANRWDELPCETSHIAHIDGCTLKLYTIGPDDSEQSMQNILQKLTPQRLSKTPIPSLPKGHPFLDSPSTDTNKPLVLLKDVQIDYADVERPIFSQVNLRIDHLQHTQITGKNGSGKSTLLKLIAGDHPQVYKNSVEVCGFKRGSGENVWQVKRFIGHMSSETFWRYRGSGQLAGKAIDVVVSGLYDSVGLYTKPTVADIDCAKSWLAIFGIENRGSVRFQRLSLAEQRLILVARAMIKRPALLILDEPCIGLDIDDRRQVLSVIEALIRAKVCTVIYVSHRDDERILGIENYYALNG